MRTSAQDRLVCRDSALSLLVALFVPLALCFGDIGPYNRLLYPGLILMLAGWLFYRRSPWYIGFCLWVFCASPLVRRLTDFQAGWDPSNPILLAPYLACSFAALSATNCLRHAHFRTAAPFVLLLGAIAYGLILAILAGRFASGLVDAMRWSVGPLFALHLLQQRPEQTSITVDVAMKSLIVAAPVMAAYGIWQFVNPSPWDAAWMANARSLGLDSIGQAESFSLRVFGPMNSPGSLAIFLMAGSILLLEQPILIALPGLALVLPALALTQYRAVWMGTLVGVALLFSRSSKARLRTAVIALCLVAAAGSVTLMPEVSQAVTERLQTLSDLGADASGEQRVHQYSEFLSSDQLIVGEGLAISGASRRLDNRNFTVIDSGIIEILSACGLLAGTLLLGCIARLVLLTFSAGVAIKYMPLYRAIFIATMIQLPFGSIHVGESGIIAWIFVAFAVAAAAPTEHRMLSRVVAAPTPPGLKPMSSRLSLKRATRHG